MPYGRRLAIAAVAVGLLAVLTGTGLTVGVCNSVWFIRSRDIHDVYFVTFVIPGIWALLLIFGVGFIADIAFRRQAENLGPRAAFICRAHLLITTVLFTAWLVAAAQAEVTWPVAIVLLTTIPLMILAHGIALTAGGLVVLRETQPDPI
jgi:hypothetical protein